MRANLPLSMALLMSASAALPSHAACLGNGSGDIDPWDCLGDYDGNGSVGNSDLTLLFNNWGEPVPPIPAGWLGKPPTPPNIGNDELTCLLNEWGNIILPASPSTTTQSIPEPASSVLMLIALSTIGWTRRRLSASDGQGPRQ